MERAGLSQRMVVGYLGPPGTFSEQAALVYKRKFVVQAVSSMEVKLEPMDSILSLILAADKGTLDKAVVPLENSLEGSIALTLDMLAHEVTVRITNEIIVPVRHNLLVKRDIPLVDIKEVISHTQALGQCSAFLRKHLPQAKLTAVNSTAEAAQILADEIPGFYPLNENPIQINSKHANDFYSLSEGKEVDARFVWPVLQAGEPDGYLLTQTAALAVVKDSMTPEEAAYFLQTGLENWFEPTQKFAK